MSAANTVLDVLSVVDPIFAFVLVVLGLAALSICCELIGTALRDLIEAKLRRAGGAIGEGGRA